MGSVASALLAACGTTDDTGPGSEGRGASASAGGPTPGSASSPSSPAVPAGQPDRQFQLAPDFDLASVDEGTVRLSELKGKVVLLDFWATWCGPCVAGIPHLNELYAENKGEGFEIIGISVDRGGRGKSAMETVRAFLQKTAMDYPLAMADARTVSAYGGIRTIPTAFLIDREGRLRKRYVGLQRKAVFERDVKELLADPAPESESSI